MSKRKANKELKIGKRLYPIISYQEFSNACTRDNLNIVKKAIEQNINLEEPRGSDCLRYAARSGSIKVFQKLDEEERTLLHCACRNGSIDIVRELIKYKVNLEEVDKNRWSAIYYAVYFEHLEIVKELLNTGVDVNLKSANQANPLYLACKRGYVEICRELIKAGADVNQLGMDERSPIHVAFINQHFDVVRELIKAKANVHQYISASKNTLFHDVCRMGNYQLFRDLVDSGIDVTTKNSEGMTAFQSACLSNHTEIITEYLKLDIETNQFNQMVEDGFYFSSIYRLYSVAKLLIPRMPLCVLKTKYKQLNRKKTYSNDISRNTTKKKNAFKATEAFAYGSSRFYFHFVVVAT